MMYFNGQVWGDKLNRHTSYGVVYGNVQIANDQVILSQNVEIVEWGVLLELFCKNYPAWSI